MDSMEKGNSDWSSRLRSGLLAIFCAAIITMLLLQAVLHTAMASRNILAYGDVTYPESSLVERTMAIVKGEALYRKDIYHWPYQVSIYGPTTYYAPALAVRAAGPESDRLYLARQVYLAGRLFSFFAGFTILLWIWFLGGQVGLRGPWRLLAIVLFFSSFSIIEMWSSFRPDFPMLAFVLWGWYFALRFRQKLAPVIPAILLAVAVSYKHTAMLSAFSLFLWLIVDRRYRDAVYFAIIFGLLSGGQFAILNVVTDGAWYLNTIKALHSPRFLPALYSLLFLLSPAEMIPLAGGFAAIIWSSRKNPSIKPLCWAFALSFLATELTLIRAGSNRYYYVEPYCWGTILAAAVIRAALPDRLPKLSRLADEISPAAIFLLALLAIPFASMAVGFSRDLPKQYLPQPTLYHTHPELARMLEKIQGDILVTEGHLAFYSKAPPTLMDPILVSAWSESGAIYPKDLVDKIKRKEFELVALIWNLQDPVPVYEDLSFLPRAAIEPLRENYQFLKMYREYFVYVPRP